MVNSKVLVVVIRSIGVVVCTVGVEVEGVVVCTVEVEVVGLIKGTRSFTCSTFAIKFSLH